MRHNKVIISKSLSQPLEGFYRDVIIDRLRQPIWDGGWKSNRIVRNCNLLLAMLMKREEGINGILYWAVGKGDENWDYRNPAPHETTSKLLKEAARKAVAREQIVFIDENGQSTDTPMPCIEVSSEFKEEDFEMEDSKVLREFGLFGGNATDKADSGMMIDYVIHPRIDMTGGMALIRKLRFMFAVGHALHPETEKVPQQEIPGFGADLPVIDIAGVGKRFAQVLNDHGIHKLSDLVAIDPLLSIGNIPMAKLRQFYGKAQMLMKLNTDLKPFAVFNEYSISRILLDRPEDLVNSVPGTGIIPEDVFNLQKDLTILQVTLDESFLKKITLGDILNS